MNVPFTARGIAMRLTLVVALTLAACGGGSYEETVAGTKLPVPNGMKRSGDKPVEIALFGFGAGQASFSGTMEPDKLVEFYKKELPARGWQESMNLRSGAAMLAYSKEGKRVLIAISKEQDQTWLNLTVGGVGK
ncbi:MAG: hypothetical protein FJ145_02385 [Deltaproteobacteria bacterium]|nr:hypothetical protein [Deltaproteobacteria bacterium]